MVTRDYGTYYDIAGCNFFGSFADSLNGADPTPESLEAIQSAWAGAVNAALPGDVVLCGEELIGPADGEPSEVLAFMREWIREEGQDVWNAIVRELLVEKGD